ncbi:hypothetical protein [Pseudomonas sp. TE21394]
MDEEQLSWTDFGLTAMVSKNHYHPLEAAILWSNLQEHRAQIANAAFHAPDKLSVLFPQWPLLQTYTERIYDAIARGELPANYLGQPAYCLKEAIKSYITIRHADFRIWVHRFFPDDVPDFLKNSLDAHSGCIPLAIYLTQKAKLDATTNELANLNQHLLTLERQISHCLNSQSNSVADTIKEQQSFEANPNVLYVIIGSLLHVTLGKSKSGRVQSIYKTQTAIVDTITMEFPTTPGLSKRTLDRKFAEARRHLAKMQPG